MIPLNIVLVCVPLRYTFDLRLPKVFFVTCLPKGGGGYQGRLPNLGVDEVVATWRYLFLPLIEK